MRAFHYYRPVQQASFPSNICVCWSRNFLLLQQTQWTSLFPFMEPLLHLRRWSFRKLSIFLQVTFLRLIVTMFVSFGIGELFPSRHSYDYGRLHPETMSPTVFPSLLVTIVQAILQLHCFFHYENPVTFLWQHTVDPGFLTVFSPLIRPQLRDAIYLTTWSIRRQLCWVNQWKSMLQLLYIGVFEVMAREILRSTDHNRLLWSFYARGYLVEVCRSKVHFVILSTHESMRVLYHISTNGTVLTHKLFQIYT